jgi:hypothetical protein
MNKKWKQEILDRVSAASKRRAAKPAPTHYVVQAKPKFQIPPGNMPPHVPPPTAKMTPGGKRVVVPLTRPTPGAESTGTVMDRLLDEVDHRFQEVADGFGQWEGVVLKMEESLAKILKTHADHAQALQYRLEVLEGEGGSRGLVKAPTDKLIQVGSQHRMVVEFEGERYYVVRSNGGGTTVLEPVNDIDDLAG